VIVRGPLATVRCDGIALHHRSSISAHEKTRRFVGNYELDLSSTNSGWRIAKLKFILKFIDGNLDLKRAA
jgi:hypothetical protein